MLQIATKTALTLKERQIACNWIDFFGQRRLECKTGVGRLTVKLRDAAIADERGQNSRFLGLAVQSQAILLPNRHTRTPWPRRAKTTH